LVSIQVVNTGISGDVKLCCMRNIALVLVVFSLGAVAVGQELCQTIANAERATYGFSPSKLNADERSKKSAAMDSYWELVKGSGVEGTRCLRGLLEKQSDTFAVYDEALLLYSLDSSKGSAETVGRAIPRADLHEVQSADYVRMGLRLAKQGIDISAVAHNYISSKADVTAYLPEHGAYKLDRTSGALLLFGSMPTDKIDEALALEVKSTNPETRNAAAVVWSLNMTAHSFKGIAALGNMSEFSEEARRQVQSTLTAIKVPVSAPKYTREQMLAKVAKFPELEMDGSEDPEKESKALDNSTYATFTASDVDTLRESRRKFITGVSNESVEGYVEMSRVLLNLINKLSLYPEYRTGVK
jgi:hypothetical protein